VVADREYLWTDEGLADARRRKVGLMTSSMPCTRHLAYGSNVAWAT